MATGKPAPKKSSSQPSTKGQLASRKQTILKNLKGLNAKAVAAHKKYDGPVSADNLGKKKSMTAMSALEKKKAERRASNAEGNTNGYASKQAPATRPMNSKKGSKPLRGLGDIGKTKNEMAYEAKGKPPKGGSAGSAKPIKR